MKKSFSYLLVVLTAAVVVLLAGVFLVSQQHLANTTTRTAKVKPSRPKQTVAPLTAAALTKNPKLKYASIIYYGIHYSKIQRWQEAANVKRGWQVQLDRVQGTTRYSVWPDQHIQASHKNLEPNWFTLSGRQVTYHSFIVHSNGDYTVLKVSQAQLLKRINHDHAGQRVRKMLVRLSVLDER